MARPSTGKWVKGKELVLPNKEDCYVYLRPNSSVYQYFLSIDGEGVERRFMTYSPIVAKIVVVKRGVVRRAKLFYLRELSGKAARIKEKKTYVAAPKKQKA